MQWRSTDERYGFVEQVLHWVIVAGLIASYFLAEGAEDEEAGGLLALHRSVGITLLALAVFRVIWRFVDRRPQWPVTMARYERVIARATHWLFYAFLFALPITGWLLSSAEGDPVRVFGLFELPSISVGAGEDAMEDLHETLFDVLVALAILHVAGALKHYLWSRDRVLQSMLPGRSGNVPRKEP